jgi:cytochrome c
LGAYANGSEGNPDEPNHARQSATSRYHSAMKAGSPADRTLRTVAKRGNIVVYSEAERFVSFGMKITKFLAIVLGMTMLAGASLAQDNKKKGGGAAAAPAGDAAKGKEVFEQCAVCHNADSDEKKMGPGLKGLFKKATLADGKTKVTDASVRQKVNEGGNGMPAYEEMLDRAEKANLMAFLKTL